MDTLTADAETLIRILEFGVVHFVGNSIGGFIALRLGARHPDLVHSVTAVVSSADRERKVNEYRPLVDALKQRGAAPVLFNQVRDEYFKRAYIDHHRQTMH